MRARPGQSLSRLTRAPRDPMWLVVIAVAAMLSAHLFVGTEGVLVAGVAVPLAIALFRRPVPRWPWARGASLPPLCLAIRFPVDAGPQGPGTAVLIDSAFEIVARRLANECRNSDRLLHRGRGCFALLAGGDGDIEQAVQFAFRVQRLCARPIRNGDETLSLTPSIGFARSEQAAKSGVDALVALAEEAAAAAALAGPGEVRGWTPSLGDEMVRHRRIADDLARAFDRNEIRPWFQPQLSTDTGEITGVEALARWEHPERGTIAPSGFLADVERCGLTGRLGQAILTGALSALRDWAEDGLEIPRVAINLSSHDLSDPKLATFVAWTLDRMSIPAGKLGLEVLETVACTESEGPAARNLEALCRMGCYIDLDDFGTGHTSISTLRALPIRRLKIDRSFVAGVDRTRDQQRMLSAILTMAEQLGLDTLGEGVETPGEHAMLAQLGCGHVQGYAIARPMPAAALRDWALRHRATLPQARLGPGANGVRRAAGSGQHPPVPPRGKTA